MRLTMLRAVAMLVGALGLSPVAGADEPPKLRVPKLAIATSVPNTVLFGVASGVAFGGVGGDSGSARRASIGVGSAYAGLAAMNFGWAIFAGGELASRRLGGPVRGNLKAARLGSAFFVIDSAVRMVALGTGLALLVDRGPGPPGIGETVAGIMLVVTNGVLLPFHIWGTVAQLKELRAHKRGLARHRDARVELSPQGFRF